MRFPPSDYAFLWVTNNGAVEITANSIASLQRTGGIGRDRLILATLDEEAARNATRLVQGVQILRLDRLDAWCRHGLFAGGDYAEFGTDSFKQFCISRYIAIDHILQQTKRPVIYADGDIAYLRNPADCLCSLQPAFRRLVLAQNDRRADIGSDEWSRQYRAGTRPGQSEICSGFTVWQPVRAHRRLLNAVVGNMHSKSLLHSDQHAFNTLSRRQLRSVMLLRQDQFPNGSLCFKNKYNPQLKFEAPEFNLSDSFIVHANWMTGLDTKVTALKRAGLWFL